MKHTFCKGSSLSSKKKKKVHSFSGERILYEEGEIVHHDQSKINRKNFIVFLFKVY